jgi:CBS domain-containing protein
MSPRAACRLDTLGFTEVYDYVPGKADWRAHGLPVEGEHADLPTAGSLARDDAITCRLNDPIGPIREQVESSRYGFALVTTEDHILLGRLRGSVMRDTPAEATAEAVMEPGPSTVRADTLASELATRLAERDLRTAIVSTPEGRLIGVVTRTDLEEASR